MIVMERTEPNDYWVGLLYIDLSFVDVSKYVHKYTYIRYGILGVGKKDSNSK